MYIEHNPVLVNEVVDFLKIKKDGIYVDATLGGGGYTLKILSQTGPCGVIVGIDQDEEAIEAFKQRNIKSKNVVLVKDNFKNVKRVIQSLKINAVNGIVFDLGVSTHHIYYGSRGFSFSREGPLDMRMDKEGEVTAEDIVNDLSAEELGKIFSEYGEERFSKRIAGGIVRERENQRIKTTGELVKVIGKYVPSKQKHGRIHFATRVFQALRIAVNSELSCLEEAVKSSIDVLEAGGRIVVVAYHSLEDRIVKTVFKTESGKCMCPPGIPVCMCGSENSRLKIITRKPVTPTEEEIKGNPKSRSARLRCAEKI
ncbi:MAG: 16S rRNA (cytosine(1402)-N(4))-methyltransferase RsmH [Armatimonadota bacterium]